MKPKTYNYLVEYSYFNEDFRSTLLFETKEKAETALQEFNNSVDIRYAKLYKIEQLDGFER